MHFAPLFSLADLASHTMSWQNGDIFHVLFSTGDYGHYFYILDNGECEVYVQKLNQPSVRVGTVHKGSSFGELALMYTGYRRATLVAAQDTVSVLSLA